MNDPATHAADGVRYAHRPDGDRQTTGSPAGQTAAALQPVCWLAAFAVDLAYTNHSDQTCVLWRTQ